MAKSMPSTRRKPAGKRPVKKDTGMIKPGGVSWQSKVLNFLTRYVIKKPVQRRGLNPSTARKVVRRLEFLASGLGGHVHSEHTRIAGVPCDVLHSDKATPVEFTVLYLHGGGFFLHLPRSYKRFARRIAERFGATVYLPDYRLAPEHRHPAAPDDCLAVYRALLAAGRDPQHMAIMGDSAGGNLALVTLLRARDEGLPLPACALLLSPGADLTFSGDSFISNAHADPLVPMNALHLVTSQYVDVDSKAHPHASPMLGNLTGLPPLSIVVGSTEVLLDSSITTAQAFRAAGGDVTLQVWEQMPHVFPLFHFLPEGRLAMEHMLAFFCKHAKVVAIQ
jgi:acetyl esterase/lipase